MNGRRARRSPRLVSSLRENLSEGWREYRRNWLASRSLVASVRAACALLRTGFGRTASARNESEG